MNTFISLRRFALLVSSLAVLGLSACAIAKSNNGHTIHTITVKYDTTTKLWSYSIYPPGDAKKAKVKRHDTILWTCAEGNWTVFFKGATPFVDASGKELKEIKGAAGALAGAELAEKVKVGDEYEYGVSVMLPGASDPVVDDPRIIIEK